LIGAGILPLCDIPQIVLSPSFSSFATSFVSISSRLSSGNRSGVGFVGADWSPGTGPGNGLSRSARPSPNFTMAACTWRAVPLAMAWASTSATVPKASSSNVIATYNWIGFIWKPPVPCLFFPVKTLAGLANWE
jgi:hypothetical protein